MLPFRTVLATTLIAACSAPAAWAQPVSAGPSQDLRSPDSRDAAFTRPSSQDLRSPDSRDAASPHPRVQVVVVPTAAPAAAHANGGRSDAPLIGAGLTGLALVGALTIGTLRRTRRSAVA
jgi:hypothetical protein